MKYLSPLEQRVLLISLRRRAEYATPIHRLKSISKRAKHALLLAFCSAGLLAAFSASTATASASAAASPSGISAPALFNEANADQRAGRLGPAILHYERARWLAPDDKAIARNLHMAREKAGVNAPAVPAWQHPAHMLGFNALAVLASVALLLLCLLVFGTRLIPTVLRGAARRAGAAFCIATVLAVGALAMRWPELNRAVVQGSHASAHIAPADNSDAIFELKAGDLVTIRRAHANFALVRTLDQRSGWVSKTDIARIIPPEATLSPM